MPEAEGKVKGRSEIFCLLGGGMAPLGAKNKKVGKRYALAQKIALSNRKGAKKSHRAGTTAGSVH